MTVLGGLRKQQAAQACRLHIVPDTLHSGARSNLSRKHIMDQVQDPVHLRRLHQALLHQQNVDAGSGLWNIELAAPWPGQHCLSWCGFPNAYLIFELFDSTSRVDPSCVTLITSHAEHVEFVLKSQASQCQGSVPHSLVSMPSQSPLLPIFHEA